jgi:hypothetical protein
MTTEKCIDCGIDLGMTAYRVPRCARCEARKEFADKVKWISDKISGLAYRNRGYFLFCPITNRAKKELELTKETGIDIWKTPERLFEWLRNTNGDFTPEQLQIIHDITLLYVTPEGTVVGIDCKQFKKQFDESVERAKDLIEQGVLM